MAPWKREEKRGLTGTKEIKCRRRMDGDVKLDFFFFFFWLVVMARPLLGGDVQDALLVSSGFSLFFARFARSGFKVELGFGVNWWIK